MNKKRRNGILAEIEKIKGSVETIRQYGYEEQEAYDNLPEGLQESERGEAVSETADAIETAMCGIHDELENLEDFI